MVNLADLDTAFLVPCKHCAELLQEGERFCPICGKDQSVTDGGGDARSDVEPERATSAGEQALSPIAVESALMQQQEAREEIDQPVLANAANEEIKPEIGLVQPDSFWQTEVLGSGGPKHWKGNSLAWNRLVIGILATLVVLLLFAVVHDHFYLDQQSEGGKLREFRANVGQVQGALKRGDLSAAERVLGASDADPADAPGVQKSGEAVDRQAQEPAAMREQLEDAARKVANALGLGAPAAPPAQAPSPPQAPVIASPAPDVADPKEKECNDARAALALCPKR